MTTVPPEIGFAGLGSMGGIAMAQNLLSAGHVVAVYNRSPDRTKPLADAGATLPRLPAKPRAAAPS